MRPLFSPIALLLLLLTCVPGRAAAQPAPDSIGPLLGALEAAVLSGDPAALRPLLDAAADRDAIANFSARWVRPDLTRVTIRERDRQARPDGTQRLLVEVLLESDAIGRLATWRLGLQQAGTGLLVRSIETISSLDGLHRLELDTSRQFRATNLTIAAEDLRIVVPRGTVLLAEVAGGVTALVVMGRGEMTFMPAPEGEQRQIRIFSGDETLRSRTEWTFVRFNPGAYEDHVTTGALSPEAVDPRDVRRAGEIFREAIAKSFSVDLADLSSDVWSLVPTPGDFLSEIRTRRFGTLTYARAGNEEEDISLFDRERRRNISVYASKARLAARGPFYDEDDEADVDVLDYHVDVSFAPDRLWFDGRARLHLRVRTFALSSLTLRLARSFAVRSVATDDGRLLFLRVRNQDSLVVNLPNTFTRDTEFSLTVSYVGRLEPQGLDREALEMGQVIRDELPLLEAEPSFVYSNRSYWYPQSGITDYGTATIRFSVPPAHAAVCSGEEASGSPVRMTGPGGEERRLHVFAANQPIRYLACAVSRFVPGDTVSVPVGSPASTTAGTNGHTSPAALALSVSSTSRQRGRARSLLERATDIAAFYIELMGEVPFPSFTLAVLESRTPGGHSPAYFAALNQPLPTSTFSWRNDPAAFDDFPEFFVAHELAHQWWGQGVGWKNYHEQWLSEGFAQYFAAMYAERRRGGSVFDGIIRSMNRWGVETSDQGEVYLGYRLGHIKNDSRILRALIYNKGAMVLHMLRRLVGDDVFVRGLRRFYRAHRFDKAGTDDLRVAFEAESGLQLGRFFDGWIYGADLPQLSHETHMTGSGPDQVVTVRLQQGPDVFDFAVAVTLEFADGSLRSVLVPVHDQTVEHRIPFEGRLRSVHVNRDRGVLLRN